MHILCFAMLLRKPNFSKIVRFTAIFVYLGESIITSWHLFLDGETCGKCRPRLQALSRKDLKLSPADIYNQEHVYWAHVNIVKNVEKSKLKLRNPAALSAAINTIVDNGGRPHVPLGPPDRRRR